MDKESLAADLVCLLEVQSREQDVAELKKIVKHFVIGGAARFDLMAKVMNLDNELGGLIFDISLPTNTEDINNSYTTNGYDSPVAYTTG